MNEEERELDEVALRIAKRYRKHCWWADVENLRQAAWVAILEARRTYDPEVGAIPLTAYCEIAAIRHLRRVLWRDSCVVDVPVGRSGADTRLAFERTGMHGYRGGPAGELHMMLHDLLSPSGLPGQQGGTAFSTARMAVACATAMDVLSNGADGEAIAIAHERRRQLRAVIEEVAVRTSEDRAALEVLLEERDLEEVAAAFLVTITRVRDTIRRIRRRLGVSADAWDLLKEDR